MLSKSLKATLLSLMLIFAGCAASVSKESQSLVGTNVSYVSFTMLDGSSYSLEDFQGKNVAILFWATWCRYSKPAIKSFNEMAEHYSQSKNAVFIAASIDANSDYETLKKRIENDQLYSLKHAFSGNETLDAAFIHLRGEHLPYFVVVDAAGKVKVVSGSISDVEDYFTGRD